MWMIRTNANRRSSRNAFLNSWYFKKILDLIKSGSFFHRYITMYINNKKVIMATGITTTSLMTSKMFFMSIIEIYESYAQEMELGKPYNPLMELGEENTKAFTYRAAFVESEQLTHAFNYRGTIQKVVQPPNQTLATINVQSTLWEEV